MGNNYFVYSTFYFFEHKNIRKKRVLIKLGFDKSMHTIK